MALPGFSAFWLWAVIPSSSIVLWIALSSRRRTHLHYNTFHASLGVCTSETSPWSNTALLWVFGKVHAFFARPEEQAWRRKHCILFVTNRSCQVHSRSWEEQHSGPNSAVFSGRSWFPEAPLSSTCKVCTDKYRSTSLMAKSLSARQSCFCKSRFCFTFYIEAGSQNLYLPRDSQGQLSLCKPLASSQDPRTWAKCSDDTAQFRFCLGNLLIFWLSCSRKDTGLVLSPTGLLDLCI